LPLNTGIACPSGPQGSPETAGWTISASPTACREVPLQILSGRDQQCLDVDSPEPSQSESIQAMPLLGFSKQRLDPDPPFSQRLLVRLGPFVCLYPLHCLGVEGANLARVLLHDADVGPTADLILPEDLYLFGDTVESSLITTHEYVPERYCLRAD
jgi:hypothetical protein